MDFTNQSQVFPEVPADQNPYDYYKTMLMNGMYPLDSKSAGNLGQGIAIISILSIGCLALLVLAGLRIYISLKTGQKIKFYRIIPRPEGNYITVENSTFIPVTMLLLWSTFLVGSVWNLQAALSHVSLYNSFIWILLPYYFLFMQALGFACGMFVGGIVTYTEVLDIYDPKYCRPICFKILQIFLALLITVTNLSDLLTAASETWTPTAPLTADTSMEILRQLDSYQNHYSKMIHQQKESWVNCICTASIPLIIKCIAVGLILRGVHIHIKRMSAINSASESDSSNTNTLNSTATPDPNGNLATTTKSNVGSHSERTRNNSLRRLQDLKKTLIWRLSLVSFPTFMLTGVSIGIVPFVVFDPNTSNSSLDIVFNITSYFFPWYIVLQGMLIIIYWLRHTIKEYNSYLRSIAPQNSCSYPSRRLSIQSQQPVFRLDGFQSSDNFRGSNSEREISSAEIVVVKYGKESC